MIKPKICITLAGKTETELLANLVKAQVFHDFVELRLDFLSEVQLEFLFELKKRLKGRSIITCRSKQDGGEFLGSDEEQMEILYHVNNLGFDFIDVDVRLIQQLNLPEKKSRVITSYHNFSHTPGYLTLKKILKKMRASRADVYKFACFTKSPKDLNSLYKLLINKKPSEQLIVLGMGQVGQISRIISPLLGSFLTFASLEESVAPGQLSFEEMRKIYKQFANL